MERKEYKELGYTLFTETLNNGLKVMYLKKPGFNKYSCYFGCNFGGKINHYIVDGKEYKIPLGVAHFLEHQMFEMPDGVNASDYLAMYGIDNNAYTSYDETMYLVSGTENFEVALNYLLDFVQTPYFKNENIDVEREIIIQELMMYADRPQAKIRERVKKNIYGNISFANDVGGNPDEVRKIDEDLLNQVYNHFYIPENMYFAIIGSFDENEVFDLIRKNQASKNFKKSSLPIVLLDKGPDKILKQRDEMNLEVADDLVYYMVKINRNNAHINKKENSFTICLKLELLNEAVFGPSSKNYQTIIDNDYANVGFYSDINMNKDFLSIAFAGYSHNPEKLVEFLNDTFKNITKIDIDEEYVDKLNKASLGAAIRDYNYFDATISSAIEYAMDGINFLDYYDFKVTKSDILEAAKYIDIDSISYAIGYGNK